MNLATTRCETEIGLQTVMAERREEREMRVGGGEGGGLREERKRDWREERQWSGGRERGREG